MNYGFFTPSELNQNRKVLYHSSQCGSCGLFRLCKNPKMKYTGEGRKKILVIGEAPGADEDKVNEQFVGKAGKRLKHELKLQWIDFFRDCWKTNAIRCHPPDNIKPDSKQIACCRPALFAEIEQLKPASILLFGNVAAKAVLGHIWDEGDKYEMSVWTDWIIPNRKPNSWISVHYHPSYLERQKDGLLDLLFRQHLKQALKKKKRPWETIPNYENEIELIYKDKDVHLFIKDIIKYLFKRPGLLSFDYETNCLKPEYKGAEIVSCSICWQGIKTAAFPWTEKAADNMSVLLQSKHKKITSNIKFEERWTRYMLGHRVRNWDWDTMLAAHALNNSTGITGLKFQSFVQLGMPAYDKHIEPYLQASKGQHINRIQEIPLKDLLIYNGMDSLYAYKIATMQKRRIDNGSTH